MPKQKKRSSEQRGGDTCWTGGCWMCFDSQRKAVRLNRSPFLRRLPAGQEAVKGVGCSINSKSKEPTNNYISILEQTLAVRRTPPGTRYCLSALKSHPEPQLSAHKPDK
ncbi:hypothetical protein EYF80_044402 [Liparis tanakae]|uniref:Uncharacterized protein n=1 Tax=Liparis tanakae TaxID=230148 RepID=A0A4Z2FWZ1_9TELE|nr:hypothetical protein EYF80_044402 [Liparis tanakae]